MVYKLQFFDCPLSLHAAPICVHACVCVCVCVCVCTLSRVQFFATPRTVVHQAPLSMDFPSKLLECMPFPPPRDLANPGTEPTFPTLVGNSLSLSHLGRHPPPQYIGNFVFLLLNCINLIIRLKNLERKKRKCFHPYSSEVGSTCFHSYFPSSIATKKPGGSF